MMACCNGKHYPEALLTVRKAGEKPLEYIKITMKEVMVSAVTTGGHGSEERITENVTLNFAKFKLEYSPQKADGSGDAAIEIAWDIPGNVKA